MSTSPAALLDLRNILAEKGRRAHGSLLTYVKQSFPGYQAGWVHEDICRRLERFTDDVRGGKSPRLMLFIPPRHGKSMIVSERFPVWYLGHNPDHSVVVTSYGASLAQSFSKKARNLAKSALQLAAFPTFALAHDRQGVEEWGTPEGGGYRAVGVGGPITGTGAHILIIDDPVKNAEEAESQNQRDKHWEWYTSTAYTRLMPNSGILVVMTRWHDDDLAGRLLSAQAQDEGDKWEVVEYPAIAEEDETHRKKGEALHPARYGIDRLQAIAKAVGSRVWTALFQQKPTLEQGGVLKKHWWKRWSELPGRFDEMLQSWDLSFKDSDGSDFVVGQVWGKKGADLYLVDQVRDRMDMPTTVEAILEMRERYPRAQRILIEDAANGPAVIATLKKKIAGIVPVEPTGSKLARASAAAPAVESGNVYIPADGKALWVAKFLSECSAFPNGENDDQVDAMSQAVNRLAGSAHDRLKKLLQ